jgi:hypothetical protein
MGNDNPFFIRLLNLTNPQGKLEDQISYESKLDESGKDNEWIQEYEVIYQSYALER